MPDKYDFKNGLYFYFQSLENTSLKKPISYQSLDHDCSKIECPICLDVVHPSYTIISKCKHAVCVDCCKLMKNNTCPMCREVFTGKSDWGYWDNFGKWVDFERIMLKNIKTAKKRIKDLTSHKRNKKYRTHAINEDMHLAKSRALIAAISR